MRPHRLRRSSSRTVVYLTGMVDVEAERARLTREIEEAEGQAERTRAQLANDNFVARASPTSCKARATASPPPKSASPASAPASPHWGD